MSSMEYANSRNPGLIDLDFREASTAVELKEADEDPKLVAFSMRT